MNKRIEKIRVGFPFLLERQRHHSPLGYLDNASACQ
jgi:hypothetical protein